MLSKTERKYLLGRIRPSKNYENKLLFSIRNKLKQFYGLELPLIVKSKVVLNNNSGLGKLTLYQTKLTPPSQTFGLPIKNDFFLKKKFTYHNFILNSSPLSIGKVTVLMFRVFCTCSTYGRVNF